MNIQSSFRIDWFDLFVVQGTLKTILQHHSSEESIRWCLAFFMVQLSDLYMTTGDTITFTRQSFYFYFLGGSDGKVSAYNVGDPGSLLLLPPIFPSIRDFSDESALCIQWPKY